MLSENEPFSSRRLTNTITNNVENYYAKWEKKRETEKASI